MEALAPAAGLLLRGAPAPSCGGAFGPLFGRVSCTSVPSTAGWKMQAFGLGSVSLASQSAASCPWEQDLVVFCPAGKQRCFLFYKASNGCWVLAVGKQNDRPPAGDAPQLQESRA